MRKLIYTSLLFSSVAFATHNLNIQNSGYSELQLDNVELSQKNDIPLQRKDSLGNIASNVQITNKSGRVISLGYPYMEKIYDHHDQVKIWILLLVLGHHLCFINLVVIQLLNPWVSSLDHQLVNL